MQGEPIRPFVLPSAGAGLSVVTYGLSPELPQGLTFDDSSRTVSGTPIEATISTEYTYTATASNGTSKSLVFTISISSSVSVGQESLPEHFAVIGNYPNPFRRSTHMIIDLPWPANLRIEVMDLIGRTLITTPEKIMTAGRSQLIEIDGESLPAGVYLYRVTANSSVGHRVEMGQFVHTR